MPRILEATCVGGVVKVSGQTVPEAVVLSAGVASSTGVLFIDEGKCTYIPTNTSDINTLIGKVVDSLTEVISALTSIDVKPVGGVASAPAPSAAGNIASLTSIKATLSTLQGNLK